jgi:GNAT superfamily N-acetyltransferase
MNATGMNVGAVASAPAAVTAPDGHRPMDSAARPARAPGDQAVAGMATTGPHTVAQPTAGQGPVEVATRRIGRDEAMLLRSLRLLALADAPRAFAGCVGDELAVPPGEWDRRALECATRIDDYVAIVTRYGTPSGLVRAYTPSTAPDRREIAAMWVAPWARGIGAGDALVEAVVAWSRQVGACALTLWVNLDNAAARRLYARHEFRLEGDPDGEPGDGRRWLRMTRVLAAAELTPGLGGPAELVVGSRERW